MSKPLDVDGICLRSQEIRKKSVALRMRCEELRREAKMLRERAEKFSCILKSVRFG